ncbi:hypothetical protein JCM10207_003404 [Rhodosporidiobolus poonsookiae]
MLALALAAPLLAASASAAVLEKRLGPLTAPGAAGFVWPSIRGWDSTLQYTAPCGGYNAEGRTDYPISGGQISLAMQRDVYDMRIGYSLKSNPTSNDDFTNLLPNVTQQFIGTACFESPDLSTLGASIGDEISFQITYQAGQGNRTFYECADLTLVSADGFKATESFTCLNQTTSTQTIPNAAANSAQAAASSSATGAAATIVYTGSTGSKDDDPVSPIGAGFIGMAVTLAVVALVLGGAAWAGFARFGSRSKVSAASRAETGTVPAYHRDSASMTSHGSVLKH